MQIMLAKDAVKVCPRFYRELNEGKILGKISTSNNWQIIILL